MREQAGLIQEVQDTKVRVQKQIDELKRKKYKTRTFLKK
jgi:hypothetical protein